MTKAREEAPTEKEAAVSAAKEAARLAQEVAVKDVQLEERADQNTQAQVFAIAAGVGLPPHAVQEMVKHAQQQQQKCLLVGGALGIRLQQAQDVQTQAMQRSTDAHT